MRIGIGHKLGAVVVLPALLAIALSAFAIVISQIEQTRVLNLAALSTLRQDCSAVIEIVQEIVIAADGVTLETDRPKRFAALKQKIAHLDSVAAPLLKGIGEAISDERSTQLALRLKDFVGYQTDTAELGLTVSPAAAQIQATDESTGDRSARRSARTLS